jgi:hypothetical protein
MGQTHHLLDFVIGALQLLALVFLVYGAYLATRGAGVRPSLGEPPLGDADSEKKLALKSALEPRRERRLHNRRKSDRRAGSRRNFYGLAR